MLRTLFNLSGTWGKQDVLTLRLSTPDPGLGSELNQAARSPLKTSYLESEQVGVFDLHAANTGSIPGLASKQKQNEEGKEGGGKKGGWR